MWNDPIVAEVHRIREQIAAECNYDLELYFARLQQEQEQYRDRLVRFDNPVKANRGQDAKVADDSSSGSAPAA